MKNLLRTTQPAASVTATLILAACCALLARGCQKTTSAEDAATEDAASTQSAPPPVAAAPPTTIPPAQPTANVLPPAPRVAPPPPALPAAIPSGMTPTRYADARVGQLTVMTQYIGDVETTCTTEVRSVTASKVFVRQTVCSGENAWQNDMTFNRYVADPQAEPILAGDIVGKETLTVGGRELICDIREGSKGGHRFRTYTSPDVLGWVVRHEEVDGTRWVRLMELTEFRE